MAQLEDVISKADTNNQSTKALNHYDLDFSHFDIKYVTQMPNKTLSHNPLPPSTVPGTGFSHICADMAERKGAYPCLVCSS